MKTNSSSHLVGFPETHWARVVDAGKAGDDLNAANALAALCEDYWRPVYGFLRRQGHSPHDSEDLTQGFLSTILNGTFLGNASAETGRFRNYLLGALQNYLRREHRKKNSLKRGSGHIVLSLDFAGAEEYLGSLAIDRESPDIIFDKLWAMRVLESVLARLEKRYRDDGRGDFFAAMQSRLTCDSGERPHADVAAEFGIDEGTLKVAFHRMKRRYRAMLIAEVARTLTDEKDVEAELLHLIAPFSGR